MSLTLVGTLIKKGSAQLLLKCSHHDPIYGWQCNMTGYTLELPDWTPTDYFPPGPVNLSPALLNCPALPPNCSAAGMSAPPSTI